ncbi:hypothetical protein ACXZ65_37195 [Streptomyces aculeolatus]
MDAKTYTTKLTELRALRDEIKQARAALVKLEAERDKQITALASHQQAKAERIVPAAGLSVAHVVTLAPALAPETLTAAPESATPTAPAGKDRQTGTAETLDGSGVGQAAGVAARGRARRTCAARAAGSRLRLRTAEQQGKTRRRTSSGRRSHGSTRT